MLKIGLVGVGYLGSRHLAHLSTLEGVQVSGVWDESPEAIRLATEKFNVPEASSFGSLLSSSDAVVLVTPTTTHFDLGLKVVEAGLPLFVEKPICASAEQGAMLVEAADRKGVLLQVGHIERFNRAYRSLGLTKLKPRFVEAHRLSLWTPRGVDVAVILDLMIHDLDLLIHLAGDVPNHIHASGVGVMTKSVDIANARLEFPSGLVANVTASRISLKRMRKLRLFGEREYVSLDLGKGTCEYVGGAVGGAIGEGKEVLGEMEYGPLKVSVYRQLLEAPEGDAMRLELSAFRDSIINGTPAVVTGEAAVRALRVAEEIIQQITKSA